MNFVGIDGDGRYIVLGFKVDGLSIGSEFHQFEDFSVLFRVNDPSFFEGFFNGGSMFDFTVDTDNCPFTIGFDFVGFNAKRQYAAFSGIVGHYHVQKNKTDPGPAMQWDRLLEDARALYAERTSEAR